ncbi:MAG TPA: PIN domain-containing protein [Pirellulales bacterium]|nr:PIN domain-containing protein [Pirellulales bacterium]
MARLVLLDSGPLGLLTAPRHKKAPQACVQWLENLIRARCRVIVPEITDYELRRELLRAGKTASVGRLDALALATEYLPITTVAMRRAAEVWAQARQQGQPTASDKTIDADMILVAQAQTIGQPFVVATTNVGHLSRFVAADLWQNINP